MAMLNNQMVYIYHQQHETWSVWKQGKPPQMAIERLFNDNRKKVGNIADIMRQGCEMGIWYLTIRYHTYSEYSYFIKTCVWFCFWDIMVI